MIASEKIAKIQCAVMNRKFAGIALLMDMLVGLRAKNPIVVHGEMMNNFKTGGPETDHVVAYVRCCRVWPVVVATLSWDPRDEIMKRETWWWRTCGYCGEYPRPVDEVGSEGDLMR